MIEKMAVAVAGMMLAGWAWGGEALSRAGGETVTARDAARAAAKGGYAIRDEATAERALGEAEDFALLAEEARREGIFDEEDIVQSVRAMAVQRLLARRVEAEPGEASEEEMRAWFEGHAAEFSRPGLVRGRVLEISKETEGWESAAEEVGTWLASEGVPGFGEALRRWGTDARLRAEGGDTGWLAEGSPARRWPGEVVAALFGASGDGEVIGPVETERAVYWMVRTELRAGQAATFEASRAAVGRRMAQEAQREAYRRFVEGLREGAEVVREEGAAGRLLEAVQGEGGPPAGPGPSVRQGAE